MKECFRECVYYDDNDGDDDEIINIIITYSFIEQHTGHTCVVKKNLHFFVAMKWKDFFLFFFLVLVSVLVLF